MVRDEKWRFDTRTGYTAFSRRDGFRLADIFYLVDAISDVSGTSTKSYRQRDNIDALLHDRVKEPKISEYDIPSSVQPNIINQMDDKIKFSRAPYNLRNSLEDNDQTRNEQQNNVQDNQPQYVTEHGLAFNTNYERPQNMHPETVASPVVNTVQSHNAGTALTTDRNVETTTRRKIEGLSDLDDEILDDDDPLGNRISSSALKSLLG